MKRRRFTKAQRDALFYLRGGICYLCEGTIHDATFEIEHVNQLWMSGDNSDDNLMLAHKSCHKEKTAADATSRAKVKRVIKKSNPETRKPSTMRSRPFPKVSRPFPKR